MNPISLDKPFTVVPAQQAVTANSFVVTYIEENYGYEVSPEDDPMRRRNLGRGMPMSVVADVEIGVAPGPVAARRITVWQGQEYLDVRGTWTDQDLYAKIKQILESES